MGGRKAFVWLVAKQYLARGRSEQLYAVQLSPRLPWGPELCVQRKVHQPGGGRRRNRAPERVLQHGPWLCFRLQPSRGRAVPLVRHLRHWLSALGWGEYAMRSMPSY